jgi:heterotetrameric sarcosine oxidase gamma subunit
MAEFLSPLAISSGHFGARISDGPGVCLSEARSPALFQIAGWRDFPDMLAPGLAELGFRGTGDYRRCDVANELLLYRTAPDRALLAGPVGFALPESLRSNPDLAVLDLSHARTRIIVEGSGVEDVMARLAPVDFRAASLPAGEFVQTGIHHVGVLIHRTAANRFEIHTPVTWARSLWDFICQNAAPFGYQIKGTT